MRGSSRDISAPKDAELEVKLYTTELERSNQELDDFAHIASHDLKEPLRGIHNFGTFLLDDYGDQLGAEGRRKLETLTKLSKRMDGLIESLLDFSRQGRTELAWGDTPLQPLVEEVLKSLQVQIELDNLEIRFPSPLPSAPCDRVRVAEVYRNLLTNAMKYSDKLKKWIEIGHEWRDQPGADSLPRRGLVLWVRDNGIGIPSRHLETIVRIFKALHGRNAYGGGSGLGLTIARKIIEKHGRRIWVESREGEGTTFYFTLEQGTS